MRVIAGRFKGRPLLAFKASHIRPTTDRVKESIFNKIMNHWDSPRVLDLFSGTGSLTIEAISRGAAEVTAVEMNRKSLQILRKNLQHFSLTDEVKVLPLDVFKFLKKPVGGPFDLILVDPPFTKKLAHLVMEALSKSNIFTAGAWVVIEASSQERLDEAYPTFELLDKKDFGDKSVAFFQRV